MNKYIIKNKKEVNNIKLGTNRDVIRDIIGDYKEFKKNKFSKNTSDKCNGFVLFYSEDDSLEAIEFDSSVDLIFENNSLFKMSTQDITNLILSKDAHTDVDGSYITSKKLNLSITTIEDKVESILFFIDGYYD